jgi:hypothetical protein
VDGETRGSRLAARDRCRPLRGTYDARLDQGFQILHRWEVSAFGQTHGRHGGPPVTVTGTGEDAVAALRDLDDRLRGVPQPDGSRMEELQRRARLAYFQGAVDQWPDMTAGELERVIERAPGSRSRS